MKELINKLFNGVPAEFSDPFNMNSIDRINIYIRKATIFDDYPRGSWFYETIIYFENGNTKGEQKLFDSTFGGLLNKIQAFCKQLG